MSLDKKRKYNESIDDYTKRLERDFGEKLSNLITHISARYGLKKEKLGELIQFSSEKNLEEFKHEVQRQKESGEIEENISSEEVQELYNEIQKLKKETEKQIETLASQIESGQFCTFDGKILGKFPSNMIKRAKNPETIPDHITGGILGAVNSTEIAITVLIDISKGIALTPLHLIKIIKGKAEYKRNI